MRIYPIAFVVFLAACFGAQTLALRLSGGRTVKSESNYFSSVARIQNSNREQPRILLLGSSMTGRMADRAAAIPGVANMGCDGGSAAITLRAIDRGDLHAAPIIVVEANSISFELEHRGKEIAGAIGSDWFKLGAKVPNFSATARPTAFAYSKLLARQSASTSDPGRLPISTSPKRLDPNPAAVLDSDAAVLADEISGIFHRLEERGSRIILVTLPPGVKAGTMQADLPAAIARQSGVLWWDLTDGLPPDAVGFTDGLHLDASSAGKVLITLVAGVDPH